MIGEDERERQEIKMPVAALPEAAAVAEEGGAAEAGAGPKPAGPPKSGPSGGKSPRPALPTPEQSVDLVNRTLSPHQFG